MSCYGKLWVIWNENGTIPLANFAENACQDVPLDALEIGYRRNFDIFDIWRQIYQHYFLHVLTSSKILCHGTANFKWSGTKTARSPWLVLQKTHASRFYLTPMKSVIGGISIFLIYDVRYISIISCISLPSAKSYVMVQQTLSDLEQKRHDPFG